MVIKGSPRGSPEGLAQHLQRTDTNERVTVIALRGVAANELTGALCEMDALGAALRTTRTLYHASINIRADEVLTPAQRDQAIDRLEAALGLTGQPRAVVEHEKPSRAGEGRIHWHVVWSRTDLQHMRAIRCDHNYRTHEMVARELEREFGHARVQGVHVEREGPDGTRIERPERTPSHAMMQQAERSGRDPQAMKAEITALWQATDSGKAFAAAVEQHGYVLARGDRRDFVVVDRAGEVYSLAKCVDGARAKDVRTRLADLDAGSLPDVAQARALQEARQLARAERAAEIPVPERETTAPVAGSGIEQNGGYQPTGSSQPTHHGAAERDQLLRDGPQSPGTSLTDHIDTHGVARSADKIASGFASLVGKVVDVAVDLFTGLFSTPPPPPTPDQQRQAAIAADENQRFADFRQFVAERSRQDFAIDTRLSQDQQQRQREEQERDARRTHEPPSRYGPER